MEGELLQYVLSAGDALARCRRGLAVAHSVFMIFGEWPAETGAEISPFS